MIYNIGIIGLGSRGLTVLERIIAYAFINKNLSLRVYLFDENKPGYGCHNSMQPDYLLVNTVASQITQFSDESVKEAGPVIKGLSFYEWIKVEKKHLNITPDAYYSRALLGEYLEWVYKYLCMAAPPNLKIYFENSAVNYLKKHGNLWNIYFNKTDIRTVDYVFLVTGHTKSLIDYDVIKVSSQYSIIENPYPIKRNLENIKPKEIVAVEGMGLTAFDIIAELTIGRGGKFVQNLDNSELEYISSSHEPQIICFSRSGFPLSARPTNQKSVSGQYKAKFLTVEKINALKRLGKIDFFSDILPLLLQDMEYAYYESLFKFESKCIVGMLFSNQFLFSSFDEQRELIKAYIPLDKQFRWENLLEPIPKNALRDKKSFTNFLYNYLKLDIQEAELGNISSPIKAASDVLRDLRDNLRMAIDFASLSESSHRKLYDDFIPAMNRIAVGPPKERIKEMLALIKANILIINCGPNAKIQGSNNNYYIIDMWNNKSKPLNWLIKARISMHSPKDDASSLIKNLLKDGYARLFINGNFHPSGLDINHHFNLIDSTGNSIDNIWVFGIPVEGPKFYTFVLPRPGVNSTAVVDAGKAVGKMFANMKEKYEYIAILN